MKTVKHQNRLLGEIVAAPPLEEFKIKISRCLDVC